MTPKASSGVPLSGLSPQSTALSDWLAGQHSAALRAAKAFSDTAANPLVKAVATDFTTAEGRNTARDDLKSKLAGSKPTDIKSKSIDTLKQVSALVDAKAPADAAAFKTWLRQISENVAEAAEEGGFMGFGGVKVSDVEKATLSDISRALGT
jgi:hypothetical protein